MHRRGPRYLALNSQSYAIGSSQGRIVQGERYDFPDDIAQMLVQAGYLRPLNPWEQLIEEIPDAR